MSASTWILLPSGSLGRWSGPGTRPVQCSTWRRMFHEVSDRRVGGQWSGLELGMAQCTGTRARPLRELFTTWPICSFRVILHGTKVS